MTIKSALPLLWIAGLGAAGLAAPQTTSDVESLAKDLTQQSAARQFDLIVTHFDEAMTSAMRWKKALAGKPEVTLRVYPGLFHLFLPSSSPGSGLGTPADYQKPGHVVEPVIEDIASWILVQRGGSK